jgi:hypothetical protein
LLTSSLRLTLMIASILHGLSRVTDPSVEAAAVAEEVTHHVSPPADDDQELRNAGLAHPFHDVLKHRLAADLEHRFRQIAGQLAHPRAAASRQQHRFRDSAHAEMFRRAPLICNLCFIRSASRPCE